MNPVFAQGPGAPNTWLPGIDPGGTAKPSQFGLEFFTDQVVPFLVSALFYSVLVLSLIFLLVGGIMWMTSSGNKEGLAKAKATVTYSLLGLALGVGSFLILNIISQFFGVNLFGETSFIPGGVFRN